MSRLALVTGASSGIGKAFAERLAADGYDLVAVGRRIDRLEELAASLTDVTVQPMTADLSTDEGIDAVAEVCASQPLTMLVNNAGVAHYMPITQLSADKARELVHVKVVAPTMLTRAAVPGMIARGAGTIINVAGMIAFGGPAPQGGGRAAYTGTLAHLVAMTQVLHEELKSEGLRVQVLCPGVVATEFHERQGLDLERGSPHVPRRRGDRIPRAASSSARLSAHRASTTPDCSKRCSKPTWPRSARKAPSSPSGTARPERGALAPRGYGVVRVRSSVMNAIQGGCSAGFQTSCTIAFASSSVHKPFRSA